jgi:nitrogen fixation-related uncharacterized protein
MSGILWLVPVALLMGLAGLGLSLVDAHRAV